MARVLADSSTGAKGYFTASSLGLAPQLLLSPCTQCRYPWGGSGIGCGVRPAARAELAQMEPPAVPRDRASSVPGTEAAVPPLRTASGSTKIAWNSLSASPLHGVSSFLPFLAKQGISVVSGTCSIQGQRKDEGRARHPRGTVSWGRTGACSQRSWGLEGSQQSREGTRHPTSWAPWRCWVSPAGDGQWWAVGGSFPSPDPGQPPTSS